MTDKKAFFWAAVLLGVLCLFCVPALAGENAGEQPETGTQDPEESQWQRQLDQKWDSALEDTDFEELEQAMEEALETGERAGLRKDQTGYGAGAGACEQRCFRKYEGREGDSDPDSGTVYFIRFLFHDRIDIRKRTSL